MTTVLLRDVSCAKKLSFLAPVAMLRSCAEFLGHPRALALKWPNDLLLYGKKVGGVLIETDARWVAVGMGINLVAHPADVPSTCLSACCKIPPAVETVLARLIYHFESLMDDSQRDILDLWGRCAVGMGRSMTVRLEGEVLEGGRREY